MTDIVIVVPRDQIYFTSKRLEGFINNNKQNKKNRKVPKHKPKHRKRAYDVKLTRPGAGGVVRIMLYQVCLHK